MANVNGLQSLDPVNDNDKKLARYIHTKCRNIT
jgi:hypothetical protein